ncbi:MAG TPA: SbcC/MukB-like Walker B domain-containing protein [Oligoflexus sp.]|uniref:ATP-binding protein n=1 Tax=Oligoflexus sp. TaxID=1971216 RepID=UPI002D805B06|nr:SbcC/MukB-like Walker B domain-containing protein [Oligoflexus sp.]HET9239578.1 SbcC/MukB-like Walker B domain-containing protein [Oligoflexus sp.]
MYERVEGYRLNRFELLNWGTFHKSIWKIEPRNHNALLTGDIGSGKSTLVDALTILLVPRPSNQIVFNKAAGAQAQERTLRSYILGEYKNEVDSDSQKARAVMLRNHGSYSVLLGYFYNQTSLHGVSLAQIFFFREKGGQPERLFVVYEGDLTIHGDFRGIDDVHQLKMRLKAKGAKVGDGLAAYASQFRRLMGITSDRALELFYQTLSMKSVADLTDFVRDHMLEVDDTRERVDILCRSFDDLDRAHKAVVKARRQIELLDPLVQAGIEFAALEKRSSLHRQQRDLLEVWRAQNVLRMEQDRKLQLEQELQKTRQKIQLADQEEERLRSEEDGIRQAIAANGGARLQELEREQKRQDALYGQAQSSRENFHRRVTSLDMPLPQNLEQFVDLGQKIVARRHELIEAERDFDNHRMEVRHSFKELNERILQLAGEIKSLEGRPNNIPRHLLELRQQICESLQLPEIQLPFVGELLQVLPTAQLWEGAIERVLHGFALSLLVDDKNYALVSNWVDQTRLKGRLVYYRWGKPQRTVDLTSLQSQSLLLKIAIKEDSAAYDWLLNQLQQRFDYRCCETLDDFRRSSYALTRQGQIKSGGDRHEKDDRSALGDRSRYVLGWNNKAKLDTLRQQREAFEQKAQLVAQELSQLEAKRESFRELIETLRLLEEVRTYEQIDVESPLKLLAQIRQERELIEGQSGKLRELQERLRTLKAKLEEQRLQRNELSDKRAKDESRIESSLNEQERARDILKQMDALQLADVLPTIEPLYRDMYQDPPNLNTILARERAIREKLQTEIANLQKRIDRLRDSIIKNMQSYRAEFTVETSEVDASLEAFADYQRMLKELQDDGLPSYESRFKEELNEKTIQSVVQFQSRLERSKRDIHERITQINLSLHTIDYNDGTYIELKAIPSSDADIRQFQQDLRSCLEGSLSGKLYDEQRFLKVKALIERFRGREGSVETDRRWTQRVTDVRHWFEFAAAEIWRNDSTVREYYESGSGKSGGQKEKLAYTVLASALAYQYGLHEKQSLDRSFRFVCIDEAFGKGSDESTRYGLELFQKLGLQLLVVTPLQKIKVIEDYVQAVHFVHNDGGKNSMLRNMSIEEYRKDRDKYREVAESLSPNPIKVPSNVVT